MVCDQSWKGYMWLGCVLRLQNIPPSQANTINGNAQLRVGLETWGVEV